MLATILLNTIIKDSNIFARVLRQQHKNSPPVFRRGYWQRHASHVVANRGGWLISE